MADNVTLNAGTGGAVMATDDIGGVHWERVKLTLGADGVNDGDVSATNPIPIKERRAATSAVTSVAGSLSSVTVLSSNANRLGAYVWNDSAVALYLKLGATASTSSFTVYMLPGAFYELPHPCYTGVIDGIWVSATGFARVTEITA